MRKARHGSTRRSALMQRRWGEAVRNWCYTSYRKSRRFCWGIDQGKAESGIAQTGVVLSVFWPSPSHWFSELLHVVVLFKCSMKCSELGDFICIRKYFRPHISLLYPSARRLSAPPPTCFL